MDLEEGIGLAAPQVGVGLNLIVLGVPMPEPEDGLPTMFTSPGEASLLPRMPIALVNPRLSNLSAETDEREEGCLSIPDVRGYVVRPIQVDVDALTLDGAPLHMRCGGLLGRCIQHEVDHLNGKLFIEYLDEEDRAAVDAKLRRLKKRTQSELKKQRNHLVA